ncbi:MAG: hypothetical protein GY737_09235 [Desulfobacteraceae bacterium]|nr:hypothetical protein [Desulfobacteraceae bacterium]
MDEERSLQTWEESFIVCAAVHMYRGATGLHYNVQGNEVIVSRDIVQQGLHTLIKDVQANQMELLDNYIEFMGREDKAMKRAFKDDHPLNQLTYDRLWRRTLVDDLVAELMHNFKPGAPTSNDDAGVHLYSGTKLIMYEDDYPTVLDDVSRIALKRGKHLYERLQDLKIKRREEKEKELDSEENGTTCPNCKGYNDRTDGDRCSVCRNSRYICWSTYARFKEGLKRAHQAKIDAENPPNKKE